MGEKFFEWGTYAGEDSQMLFPVDSMEEIFLVDMKKENIWLSKKTAELLADGNKELKARL